MELEYRTALLKELFGSTGDHITIKPPFRCDYGRYIHAGDNFYANFDCIIIDVCEVIIGDHVIFCPRESWFREIPPPGISEP